MKLCRAVAEVRYFKNGQSREAQLEHPRLNSIIYIFFRLEFVLILGKFILFYDRFKLTGVIYLFFEPATIILVQVLIHANILKIKIKF